jgi:hypothetical protein
VFKHLSAEHRVVSCIQAVWKPRECPGHDIAAQQGSDLTPRIFAGLNPMGRNSERAEILNHVPVGTPNIQDAFGARECLDHTAPLFEHAATIAVIPVATKTVAPGEILAIIKAEMWGKLVIHRASLRIHQIIPGNPKPLPIEGERPIMTYGPTQNPS